MATLLLAFAFLAMVPLANWMIGNVGTVCPGPCLIPVGNGLMAPSGVVAIGVALVLRDVVRERTSLLWVALLQFAGALLSALIAPPALALASFAAFAFGEFVDAAAYEPLRRRGAAMAVLVSGAAGAVIDSLLFLAIAFGSMDYLAGQVVGKLWASAMAAAALALRRRRI